ncbi:MAG: hypothetical protein HY868_27245 [Chloroflexi bacterium]|nr:hypothetical protein [Chloroflexota bacterium]
MNGKFFLVAFVAFIVMSLNACGVLSGASAATINDVPAYPGASELKAGDSRVGDTLAKNMQGDAALRQAMGAGGKMEQKGFVMPKEATWDAVKRFYDDKLKAAGWGDNGMVSNVLAQVNQQNEMTQTALYLRGNQNLAVIRIVDPISKDAMLIVSLSTR